MVEIPTTAFLAAVVALVGAIGTLFTLLMRAQKALADERKDRTTAAEDRNVKLAEMVAVQNEILERVERLTEGRLKREAALPRARPPFPSNPGTRRGPEDR